MELTANILIFREEIRPLLAGTRGSYGKRFRSFQRQISVCLEALCFSLFYC